MFFRDELVEASLRPRQNRLQRQLGSIMRRQLETARGKRVVSCEIGGGKSEPAETGGNESGRCALTAPDEEVAPILIH